MGMAGFRWRCGCYFGVRGRRKWAEKVQEQGKIWGVEVRVEVRVSKLGLVFWGWG